MAADTLVGLVNRLNKNVVLRQIVAKDFTQPQQRVDAIGLVAGINNLFNQKYWLWGDVRQADTSLRGVDFYTQPGRNFRLSFQADL